LDKTFKALSSSTLNFTSEHLAVLQFYNIIPCKATLGEGSSGMFTEMFYSIVSNASLQWTRVPDGGTDSFSYIQCFGTLEIIRKIMQDYTHNQLSGPLKAEFTNLNGSCGI